ncbi:MAG: hypothetical protein IAG10_23745 [Planctomycetaceae bacterium]|nr:hypothetical protein [Planctomycetaceae bacterium]
MNFQVHGGSMGALAFLALLFGLISTVFWMVVGWRAMRAHEQIAECCDGWLRIWREERILALRTEQGTATVQPLSGEETFTPLKDAPPEYPWSKEV